MLRKLTASSPSPPLPSRRVQNLMRCDLSVVTPANPIRSYEIDSKGRIALYSKFFRIIELASDFLEVSRERTSERCDLVC